MSGPRTRRAIAALAALFATIVAGGAAALERTTVSAEVEGQRIAVVVYRPDGAGPFPLLILSHGSPRKPADRASYGEDTLRRQAEAYAASGVAVAVPIRRGYGGAGDWAEGYGGCEHPDYYDAGLASARDIAAARAAVSKLPGIDGARVVLMGVSAGGWASLAAATAGGVRGVVNFAGGRGSRGPDDVCGEDELIGAVARYGAASRAPELWFYSQNDRFFGPALAHRLHEAFTAAGGKATFVAAPPYRDDGHGYIADIASWKPEVDRFLRRIGFLDAARGSSEDSAGKVEGALDKAARAAAAATRAKDGGAGAARPSPPQ